MDAETIKYLVGAILAAIPATIIALATLRAAKRVEAKTDENTTLTQETKEQADNISNKADEIHTITEKSAADVNGNLSALKEELTSAVQHNKELQETIKTLTSIIRSRPENAASDFNEGRLRRSTDKKE